MVGQSCPSEQQPQRAAGSFPGALPFSSQHVFCPSCSSLLLLLLWMNRRGRVGARKHGCMGAGCGGCALCVHLAGALVACLRATVLDSRDAAASSKGCAYINMMKKAITLRSVLLYYLPHAYRGVHKLVLYFDFDAWRNIIQRTDRLTHTFPMYVHPVIGWRPIYIWTRGTHSFPSLGGHEAPLLCVWEINELAWDFWFWGVYIHTASSTR